jgi:hypothetical protein
MKKIFSMIALSVALGLSTGYAGNGNNIKTTDDCEMSSVISVNAKYDHDAIGKSELTGSLTNSSEQDYKNVNIRVDFLNDKQEMIGSHVVQVNEDVEAGETEDFQFELNDPKGTETARWTVMCSEED